MGRLPAPPRLPTLPTEAELAAVLEMFERAAERDTQRRLKVVMAETVRPGRK